MYSIRKWIFRPKKSDKSLLARLYYADEALNAIAAELDSFDGRKEPERCTLLINKLRNCQDKVLGIVEKIIEEAIPGRRASRDFRVKFPDDVLQDNLAGQLWFGAECLSAGSSIMNREVESASMRPLARSLTRHLDQLRTLLREHCFRNQSVYPEELKRSLEVFDKLFAEFELSYVSAMVPVKTMRDYDILQEVMVLFSETLQRALKQGLITQEMLDDYDPAMMFTIPRLAIVCGLMIYPEGPLNPDMDPVNMCEMFRPFQTLLYKIRELLSTLTTEEFHQLEKCLCSNEEPEHLMKEVKSGEDKQQYDSPHERDPVNTPTFSQTSTGALNPEPLIVTMAERKQESLQEEKEESVYLSSESGSYGGQMLTQGENKDAESLSDSEVTYDSESSLHSSSETVSSHNTDDIDEDVNEGDSIDVAAGIHGARQKAVNGCGMQKCMPHQESKDSGMPSEPDPLSFETHTVESHRLRHSRSWPDTLSNNIGKKSVHGKSPSMNECIRRGVELGATGGGPSLELIDSSHSDSDGDGAGGGFLNRSAQEFTFNIPRNTSLDDPVDDSGVEPSINIEGCEPQAGGSISGSTSGSSNASPSHLPGHMAYITDALNSTFMTDPDEALEVTFVAGTPSEASPEQSAVKPKEGPFCDMCQKRETFSHISSPVCDTPCDSTCDPTEPCDCIPAPLRAHDRVQALHSQSTELCLSCQQRIASSGGNEAAQDTKGKSSYKSSGVRECRHHKIKVSVDRQRNMNSVSSIRTSSDAVPFQNTPTVDDVGKPGTSSISSRQDTERSPSKSSCRCKTGSGRHRRNQLETARSSKVHYRRMKSTESGRSRNTDKASISSNDSTTQASDTPEESEITLAIQAAEVAVRKEARARFKTSGELIHRLFVCISGVADQLQTNYAADLRHILKCVFECNSSEETPVAETGDKTSLDAFVNISAPESPNESFSSQQEQETLETEGNSEVRQDICTNAPAWVPDEEVASCTACKAPFTFVRRRHHCRNCGNIFCGRCSSNNVPLPQYGHDKPVRVCNRCFMFHVTPFTTVDE